MQVLRLKREAVYISTNSLHTSDLDIYLTKTTCMTNYIDCHKVNSGNNKHKNSLC